MPSSDDPPLPTPPPRTRVDGGDCPCGILVQRAHDAVAPAHQGHLISLIEHLQARGQAGRRAGRQRHREDQQVSATALGVEVSVGLPSHGMSPACSRPAPSQQPHNHSHNHGLAHPPARLPGPATGCCCASAAWCPRAGTWRAAAAPQTRESRGRCSAAQAPCARKGGRGTGQTRQQWAKVMCCRLGNPWQRHKAYVVSPFLTLREVSHSVQQPAACSMQHPVTASKGHSLLPTPAGGLDCCVARAHGVDHPLVDAPDLVPLLVGDILAGALAAAETEGGWKQGQGWLSNDGRAVAGAVPVPAAAAGPATVDSSLKTATPRHATPHHTTRPPAHPLNASPT